MKVQSQDISIDKISISQLKQSIGGISSAAKDLVVCNNFKWDESILHKPYRAEAVGVALCIEGNMTISVNMQVYSMGVGSVILYGRENMVELLEMSEECRFNLVLVTERFIKDTMLDLKSLLPIYQYVQENRTELLTLDRNEVDMLNKFYTLMEDTLVFGKSHISRDLVASFIRTLSEMYSHRIKDLQTLKTRQEEYLERFVNEVNTHHREQRSVKFYADALHITPKYLSTVIKDVSGRSAAEWIDDFVIQEAKMMLKFSSKSIQEITYALNFSTQSFFGKYFKRHTGMSPSEYRQSE